MNLLGLFGSRKKPDSDELVLIQLRKAGSDFSKPHAIEFFLYFPTQALAEQAASEIQRDGFATKVSQAAKGPDWLCFATKTVIPKLAALHEIGHKLNALAESLGGEYDGWGTEVVK